MTTRHGLFTDISRFILASGLFTSSQIEVDAEMRQAPAHRFILKISFVN